MLHMGLHRCLDLRVFRRLQRWINVRIVIYCVLLYTSVCVFLLLQQNKLSSKEQTVHITTGGFLHTHTEKTHYLEVNDEKVEPTPANHVVLRTLSKDKREKTVKRPLPNLKVKVDGLKNLNNASSNKSNINDKLLHNHFVKPIENSNPKPQDETLNITALLQLFKLKNNSFKRPSEISINNSLDTRSSPFDFPFLINGQDICKNVSGPFLVILIPSVHTHIELREAIRQSWGKSGIPGVWPLVGRLNETVRIVFLFGRSKKSLGDVIVDYEHKANKDVVQADFVDSYFNLTRKMVMGVRWVAEYCPNAKYILKADEDVFVHVHNLIKTLKPKSISKNGNFYGHTHENAQVMRTGKWEVKKSAYPFAVYPTYACGNTYVISGNIASRVFDTVRYLAYLSIEDVFMTGIVRTIIGADILDVAGFTFWYDKQPKPCEFKNTVRISATKVDSNLQTYIWEELKRKGLENCYVVMDKKQKPILVRPEQSLSYRKKIKDDHIFYNYTSGKFYIV